MSLTNLFFLPAIFFIGALTTYEDIVLSRIRNRWILSGMAYSMLSYTLLYLLSYFKIVDYHGVNTQYIRSFALNLGISVIVAYALWKFGAWAPGDAKLFIAYTMLVPLDFYSKEYINHFPSVLLLFNIFIPLFLVIVMAAPFKLLGIALSILKDPGKLKTAIQSLKGYPAKAKASVFKNKAAVIAYLFIFLGLRFALKNARLSSLWMAIILLLSQPLTQWVTKSRKILLLVVVGGSVYFSHRIIYGQGLKELIPLFWQTCRVFSLFWLLRILLVAYIKYTQVKKIEVSRLEPNAVPTEESLKLLQPAAQEPQQRFGQLYPDGLSREQVEMIKNACREKGIAAIEVYRTFPFASWIFLGVIITLIFRQGAFAVIKTLLNLIMNPP